MPARAALTVKVVAICGLLAGTARAQGLSGTVRDSVSRLPVSGAVVMTLDSAGATLARGLTNERGQYRVPLRGAARFARVVRIGFVPVQVPLPSSAGAIATLDIAMYSLPSMLEAKRVVANSHCSTRGDRAAALGLWEQARAGLLATIVARESNPAVLRRLGFERVMDGNSDRIVRMRVRADSADTVATSFFAAHSAADLVRYGFSSDSTNTATFFGPDADVLLNDYFAGAYCFDLAKAPRSRAHQVGLRFVPAEHRRGHIDIDGTLWIDTLARALKDIEFRYVGMSAGATRYDPGGMVAFQSMPNGVVLISRWSLRLVSAEPDTIVDAKGKLSANNWLYADETGGELAHATWPDGTAWNAPLGALRITATDEHLQPAAGVVFALAATQYFGTTNARGQVEIKDLLPGPYTLRVIAPGIASLGIGLPTGFKFVAARDSTTLVRLRVPTAKQFTLDRCAAAGQRVKLSTTTNGVPFTILGRVFNSRGEPVEGATISVATKMLFMQPDGSYLIWLKVPYVTGSDGIFQACHNWDLKNQVLIRVHRFGLPDVEVEGQFTSDQMIVRLPVP